MIKEIEEQPENNLSDALASAAMAENAYAHAFRKADFKKTFFDPIYDTAAYGQDVDNILKDWEDNPSIAPSMPDIIGNSTTLWGFDKSSKYYQLAMQSGKLGHTPTAQNVTYHAAPAHPRKVLLQAIRLINTHNQLAAQGLIDEPTFTERESFIMMAVAAIHDLKHDGNGNGMGDAHEQYRLEQKALDIFLNDLGHLIDEKDKKLITLMLKCTDPSCPDGPLEPDAPLSLMRRFYKGEIPEEMLPEDLKGLACPRAMLMCMTFDTCDLANAAGLSKRRAQIEAELLVEETGVETIREASSLVGFIDKAQLTLLPSAKMTYGCNPETIQAQLTYDDALKSTTQPTLNNNI